MSMVADDDTKGPSPLRRYEARGCRADSAPAGSDGNTGPRPQEPLEAALAACANMTIRMAAAATGLRLTRIRTTVTRDRSAPGPSVFRHAIAIDGTLDDEARAYLLNAADRCPVCQRLHRAITLERDET